MNRTKDSIIGNMEGILRDYEDGYKWISLLSEITYSDLKWMVSLAKKSEQYQQILSEIAEIDSSLMTEKQALDLIKEMVLPILNEKSRI